MLSDSDCENTTINSALHANYTFYSAYSTFIPTVCAYIIYKIHILCMHIDVCRAARCLGERTISVYNDLCDIHTLLQLTCKISKAGAK